MGEPLGLLKVTVVRGKGLVIRDFKSSDPYVVLKVANQTAKTKVISSSLNPTWDEEFSFRLTGPVGELNLVLLTMDSVPDQYSGGDYMLLWYPNSCIVAFWEVFDKDRFKRDDKMGHASVSLQPLLSTARLRQILKVCSGETTLRKVVPDSENCLVRESSITCVNGEVIQEVWLRLRDVESGEIQLKIKLIEDCFSGDKRV